MEFWTSTGLRDKSREHRHSDAADAGPRTASEQHRGACHRHAPPGMSRSRDRAERAPSAAADGRVRPVLQRRSTAPDVGTGTAERPSASRLPSDHRDVGARRLTPCLPEGCLASDQIFVPHRLCLRRSSIHLLSPSSAVRAVLPSISEKRSVTVPSGAAWDGVLGRQLAASAPTRRRALGKAEDLEEAVEGAGISVELNRTVGDGFLRRCLARGEREERVGGRADDKVRLPRRLWCSKTSSRHVPVVLMMQAAENRATDEPLRFGAP